MASLRGLREGIEALIERWETSAKSATARGLPSPQDGLTFAQERHASDLRALLDAVPDVPPDTPTADARTVVTRDGFETEFNAQSDAEAKAYKAGWADALSEIRDEDALRGWGGEGADTPTADAPADTDLRELIVLGVMAAPPHPQWSPTTELADFIADELLPLVRAQVEASRRDAEERALQVVREAVHQADVRQESGLHTRGRIREAVDNYATRNVYAEIRDRAARGETRQL